MRPYQRDVLHKRTQKIFHKDLARKRQHKKVFSIIMAVALLSKSFFWKDCGTAQKENPSIIQLSSQKNVTTTIIKNKNTCN